MRLVFLFLFATCAVLRADSDSLAETRLKEIVADERQVFADAEAAGDKLNQNDLYNQLQAISRRYDALLADNPNFTPVYVSYGLLLNKIGMKREAAGMFLKANKLDSNLAIVKNQLGNIVAEAGKPLEAVNYYISAIDLEPKEPLYHFQLGTLLTEATDDFLKAGGVWTREKIDQTALQAFKTAAELAPDNWRYAYRYGLAFYDLETPNWNEALAVWQRIETRMEAPLELQICHLHQANVLLKLGHRDEALPLLDTVTDPALEQQKAKLLAPTPAPANP